MSLRRVLLLYGVSALLAIVLASGMLPEPWGRVIALLTTATALVTWSFAYRHEQRLQRMATGMCIYCGYDLTGNVSGVCPECGAAWQK